MKKIEVLIIALFVFSGLYATEYDTIRVSDFGVRANSRENVVPAVKKALQIARKFNNPLIVFESGRYDFWPHHAEERSYHESNTRDNNPKRLGILIENFDRLTIDGNGASFVFHDRMQPVTIDHSSHIDIRNFTIDWDVPLLAQAEILKIDSTSVTLKIDKKEFPYGIEDNKLRFYGEGWKGTVWEVMEVEKKLRIITPQTGGAPEWSYNDMWGHGFAEEIVPGVVKLHQKFSSPVPKVGNIFILRHTRRDHSGMFVFHSKDVNIYNISIYHTAGLGVLSQFSENITFKRVKMVPNEGKGRYFSAHDDGLHFSNCKGQINITDCEFAMLMDDCINIHGTSVRIVEKMASNKLRCRFMHPHSVGLQWARKGEKIGFIENESMETIAFGKVASFNPLNESEFEIEFEDRIPDSILEKDALENLTWVPDAYIVHNRFMNGRARGILVSTPGKVVIEDNYFESSGCAILIAGDANYWFETGAVKDVTIRKNVFADPCLTAMYQFSEAIISIFPEIPYPERSKTKFHHNIHIEDNEFHPFDYPILYALSVDGLEFKNNNIIRSYRFEPFHHRKCNFSLQYCKNVDISGNVFSDDLLGRNILFEGMKRKDYHVEKNQRLKIERK